ncbi:HlyD family efflux transporter periplasmic adaptor subunit [Roseitranquillus sediminis]|uniref:HlyD family efflux transporter periplasmic adaptor subunit n=1 Tax=Roseitranquillus sediminis TaxID=2809051 RepID=UPI001D0C42ED|nr:HlyD family efflux transporter periplasmic adaptor subunit [Roseitranquillus sediminis]MBM9594206.1 HlyD family efflux transporter periplasmic adaptor subunit [Roseitranquillus sediminis]
MVGKWFFKASVAVLLIGAAGYSLMPHETSYVSTSAVVNAPVYVIRAPFDGLIEGASPPVAGGVAVGEELLRVSSGHRHQGRIDELSARASVVAAELEAVRAQRAAIEALAGSPQPIAQVAAPARISALGVMAAEGGAAGESTAEERRQIALRLIDLDARQAVLSAEAAALRQQIDSARRDAAGATVFAPEASVSGVVWSASPAQGLPVSAGDEMLRLLDCGRRFVEVILPDRHFDAMRPESLVSVQLRGSGERIVAPVQAVRGAGARADVRDLAAAPAEGDTSGLRVLVRLQPADVSRPGVAASFCDVGRTAEVRFPRKSGRIEDLAVIARDIPRQAATLTARLARMIDGTVGL